MSVKPKKILVVEDDVVTRNVIVEILKSGGYETHTASDGATTVKICREIDFDLITLDVVLAADSPGDSLDGFKLATWLKRLNTRVIPTIIISGINPDDIVVGAAAVQAYTFLPKPVEKKQLLSAVAEALK